MTEKKKKIKTSSKPKPAIQKRIKEGKLQKCQKPEKYGLNLIGDLDCGFR